MSKPVFRTWVYHPDKEPQIIDSDQFNEYEKLGWFDSPAKYVKTTDFGIDPSDSIGVQTLGESLEGIKDNLNAQLNFEEMKPKELKAYALDHHGMEIKGNREKLIKQVKGLNDGDRNKHNH